MLPVVRRLVIAILPLATLTLLVPAAPSAAQTPVSLHLDSAFYVDNTEFDGPFRSGETILGACQRLFFDLGVTDRATLRLGVFTTERAGSPTAIDHALPVVALRMGTPRHRVILGTIDSAPYPRPFGPDRTTPHGLLPPLATETFWFLRAYEAGAQWLAHTDTYSHDIWFDYQAMNTPHHREKFDVGGVGRGHVAGPLDFAYQVHVVHRGGQQFDVGPVSDSFAFAPGLVLQAPMGDLRSVSLELYGLASVERPNRAVAPATVKGKAAFVRAAAEVRRWRGHLIAWRGDNFIHEDGDPNYLSLLPDGARFRRVRDYEEIGVARRFTAATVIDVEASLRLHRIESSYTYSYRVLGTVHLKLWEATLPAGR